MNEAAGEQRVAHREVRRLGLEVPVEEMLSRVVVRNETATAVSVLDLPDKDVGARRYRQASLDSLPIILSLVGEAVFAAWF